MSEKKITKLPNATRLAAVLCASAMIAGPVQAHHSFAMFDMTKQSTIEGTVKAFQFANPHIWIYLVVTDPKTGRTTQWQIEGSSPNTLARLGWNRSTIKSGDKAKIVVNPLRNGKPGGSLVSLQTGTLKIGT